jgi:hypothetical protein
MKDVVHVAVGGGCCLLRTAAVLTRAQIGRVPVPPVMFRVRLLVVVVVLRRFAQELCKGRDVNGSCLLLLPFAARKSLLDLLQQPAVPVWILKRGKREVGTTFRVAPNDARVLHGVVEGAASVVEDLADVDAAAIKSSRAASTLSTARTKSAQPDLADVTPLPKMIDASERGGVNCIPRKFSFTMSISNRNPSFS